MVKDDDELELIRAAVRLGATVIRSGARSTAAGSKRDRSGGGDGVRGAAGRGARRCRFLPSLLPEQRSALPHGRATEQVIAPRRIRGLRFRCYTRRLLFGPDPHCMGGRCFGNCHEGRAHGVRIGEGGAGRRRLRRCGRALASRKWMRRRARYCARLGWGDISRIRPGMEWVWRSTRRPGLRPGRRKCCGRAWSSRLNREYTSPANGA